MVTTTEYETMIFKSSSASKSEAPSTERRVASITLIRSGSNIGNERTGYSVPLEFAFEMIAAINVEAEANPKLPMIMVNRKIEGVCTMNEGMVRMYANIIIAFKT